MAKDDALLVAFLGACKDLATVSSSDGSGHADLARRWMEEAGFPKDQAIIFVEMWQRSSKPVASKPWRE